MADKELDKRVRRTRKALADALISLAIEKGYDDVTVQDILDRAGVGRSTFYGHFRNKEELFSSSLDGLRSYLLKTSESLVQSNAAQPGELGFVLPFLKHVNESRAVHRALTRGESALIMDRHLRHTFAELVRSDIGSLCQSQWNGASFEAAVQYIVGALMSLMTWWLDRNIDLSPAELNAIFVQISLQGIKHLL